MENYANKMINFIDESPTNFHAIINAKNYFEKNGFNQIKLNEKWSLEKGKSYYVINEDTSMIAFSLSDDITKGFNIIGAHSDYPCIKIKPNPESTVLDHFVKLNVEIYGGPIISTWFDRGLSIAGKVILKNGDTIKTEFIDAKKTLLTIPSIAIHLVRDNEQKEINKQNHMQPLLSLVTEELTKGDYLYNVIKNEIDCEKDDILDYELYIYNNQKGEVFGLHDEFIQHRALDDMFMLYSGITSLVESKNTDKSRVMLILDNEEIGSNTATGARSSFIQNTLERICLQFSKERDDFFIALNNSMCLSADLAHSYHPNYEEKSDPTNKPVMGKGLVFKTSANKKYSTESTNASIFKNALSNKNIPYQLYVNRSDIIGGSTVGPMLSQKLGISAVDVGAAIFAMHSTRETSAVSDVKNVIEALSAFYEIV